MTHSNKTRLFGKIRSSRIGPMKLISRLRDYRYCAFCKSRRHVYLKKHIDLTNVVAAVLLSAAVTQAYWGQVDPRGLVLFCVVVGISEVMVYLRWRLAVVCKMCGFDPVVYKRSPSQAALRVREFFTQQVDNPRFQLSKSPLLDLHRRQRLQQRKRKEFRSSVVGFKAPMIDPRAP